MLVHRERDRRWHRCDARWPRRACLREPGGIGARRAFVARRDAAAGLCSSRSRNEVGGDRGGVRSREPRRRRAAARRAPGEVDVLVANAALPASGELTELTQEQIDRMLEVNLRAPIALARALAPAMIERGRGHMVFVSSLCGQGRLARLVDLLGDEVRAARLRARPPRGPAPARRRRVGRAARASSATPACSPTPRSSYRSGSAHAPPRTSPRR